MQGDDVAGLREPARLELAGELGDDVEPARLGGLGESLRERALDVVRWTKRWSRRFRIGGLSGLIGTVRGR